MVARFRVRLALQTPFGTRFHSGTIFGHLCWAYLHLERELEQSGLPTFHEWLAGLQSGDQPPVLVSDGFPAGYLPFPLLKPLPEAQTTVVAEEQRNREWLKQLEATKKRRKIAWLSVECFCELRSQMSEATIWDRLREHDSSPPVQFILNRLAHNTINRLTGTTPREGGLYFVDEFWPRASEPGQPAQVDIWIQCNWQEHVLRRLFCWIGEHGYGRDASTGRGRFSVVSVEPAPSDLFDYAGNRRMSLSHGTLTPNMLDPCYRLETHYGKLGGWLASSGGRPFKYPLLLTRPGATFRPGNDGPYGELLTPVHADHSWVVHNAWHLTVPFHEPDTES